MGLNAMDIPRPDVVIRPVRVDDQPHLDDVRQAAFAPVFASFRSILGDDIYDLAQAREDEAQGELLVSLLAPESGWEVYAAEMAGSVIGFVSIQLNPDTQVGEIGLNAVHPDHAGKGVGTAWCQSCRPNIPVEVTAYSACFWNVCHVFSCGPPLTGGVRQRTRFA
jgi:GNAT superfamily N-acetyltransferase